MTDRSPLAAAEIAVLVADVLLCLVLCGVAAILASVSIGERLGPNSPHAGAFQTLGVLIVGGPGALFGLAGIAVARRWRGRGLFQALPVLASLGVALWLLLV